MKLSAATSSLLIGSSFAATSLWKPQVGTTWQIVLSDSLKLSKTATSVTPNVAVYDIDLYTNTNSGKDTTIIDTLHRLNKKVICYFSAGSYEPGRPDSNKFLEADKGNGLDGWPGERWLNLRSQNVRNIMAARIKLASQMGCDAIDPDNVDGYGENNGNNGKFKLTEADSIDFVKFLAAQAKQYNLAVGLKNAAEIIEDVISVVHFSVNEECAAVPECSSFQAFTLAGKPVFHIEYPNGETSNSKPVTNTTKWCKKVAEEDGTYDISNFSTVIKNMDLDGWVQFCDKSTAITPTN